MPPKPPSSLRLHRAHAHCCRRRHTIPPPPTPCPVQKLGTWLAASVGLEAQNLVKEASGIWRSDVPEPSVSRSVALCCYSCSADGARDPPSRDTAPLGGPGLVGPTFFSRDRLCGPLGLRWPSVGYGCGADPLLLNPGLAVDKDGEGRRGQRFAPWRYPVQNLRFPAVLGSREPGDTSDLEARLGSSRSGNPKEQGGQDCKLGHE